MSLGGLGKGGREERGMLTGPSLAHEYSLCRRRGRTVVRPRFRSGASWAGCTCSYLYLLSDRVSEQMRSDRGGQNFNDEETDHGPRVQSAVCKYVELSAGVVVHWIPIRS